MIRRLSPGTAALAGAAMTAALLAGCGGSSARTASAPEDPGPHPVVTVPQAQKVLDAIDQSVEAGVAERDVQSFGARVVDPFLTLAKARFAIETATKASATPVAPVERTRLIVPEQGTWPRFFLSVGSSSAQATPVLRLLRSSDARSPYGLSAELTMLPGATLPAAADAEDGAPVLAATDATLVTPPGEVLTRYADVLTKGDASEFAAHFDKDVYREQTSSRVGRDTTALASVATVAVAHEAVPESVVAVGLEDGSALVLGEIRQRYTITVKPRAGTVSATADIAALAGRSSFATTLVRTSTAVVAFVVPPEGAVTPIAVQAGPVAVTGS